MARITLIKYVSVFTTEYLTSRKLFLFEVTFQFFLNLMFVSKNLSLFSDFFRDFFWMKENGLSQFFTNDWLLKCHWQSTLVTRKFDCFYFKRMGHSDRQLPKTVKKILKKNRSHLIQDLLLQLMKLGRCVVFHSTSGIYYKCFRCVWGGQIEKKLLTGRWKSVFISKRSIPWFMYECRADAATTETGMKLCASACARVCVHKRERECLRVRVQAWERQRESLRACLCVVFVCVWERQREP